MDIDTAKIRDDKRSNHRCQDTYESGDSGAHTHPHSSVLILQRIHNDNRGDRPRSPHSNREQNNRHNDQPPIPRQSIDQRSNNHKPRSQQHHPLQTIPITQPPNRKRHHPTRNQPHTTHRPQLHRIRPQSPYVKRLIPHSQPHKQTVERPSGDHHLEIPRPPSKEIDELPERFQSHQGTSRLQ